MHPRGGYQLDMQWKDGKLTQTVLRDISNKPGKVQVRYVNTTGTFEIDQGSKQILRNHRIQRKTLQFATKGSEMPLVCREFSESA